MTVTVDSQSRTHAHTCIHKHTRIFAKSSRCVQCMHKDRRYNKHPKLILSIVYIVIVIKLILILRLCFH